MANDLYYEESYTKKQLLEVLGTKDHNKTFRIDCIAEERGQRILRLSLYHGVFNPIELIWSELIALIKRNNTTTKFTANTTNVISIIRLPLIREEVSKISPTCWSVRVM